jgi:hypothetical protein
VPQAKKKLYWHSVFGEIKIEEQIFRQSGNGLDIRPFSVSAGVRCRQYSQFLQRAIVDFGSDVPFKNAPNKLKEHYGIDVPETAVRLITERHGEAIHRDAETQHDLPDIPGVSQLITEMDGSKIPVVETAERKEESKGIDLRKTRKLSWKEARLCLAHEVGSVTPVFGVTTGSTDEAGDQLLQCAIRAEGGTETRFHCVGDGATWIADQGDRVFGSQANYLVDFYHLCEYLSGAAGKIAGKDKEVWMEQQKDRLKENAYNEVLKALQPFVEGKNIPDEDAPVRVCHRYISNRTHQLDYKGAIAAGLPIGSGEIESAHRYIIQARLKLAGAWWKITNATKMLALRVLRANGDWDKYWNNLRQEAA